MAKSSRKLLLRAVLLLPVFLFAFTANAADLRIENGRSDQSVYRVPANDTVKNLYAIGSQIVVEANSSKDAVVLGGTVNINGSTTDDLLVAGGNVNIRGNVGGSARILGGTTNIEGKITEDLVVVGGTVYISSTSDIGGDLIVLGGNVTLDAPVHGEIRATSGSLEINSAVNGNVNVRTSRGLTLGPAADLKGDLNYSAPALLNQDSSAKVAGTTNYTQMQNRRTAFRALLTVAFFIKLLAMMVAAFVMFWVFRGRFTTMANRVTTNFWKNALIGFASLVLVPICAFILFATLIGFYLGLILLAIYFLALLMSLLISSAALGSWLLSKVNDKEANKPHPVRYRSIALGIIVVAVLSIIPVVGGIIMLLLMLAGFGSMLSYLWQTRTINPQ